MNISERLKLKRIEKNLSQQEVGEYINVSKATVQRYETGDIKNLKQENIEKLGELFDVSPGWLLGWEDEQGQPTQKYIEKKSFVTELLETMVRQGLITDPNNIDDDMKKMILDSVRLEVQKILKAGN